MQYYIIELRNKNDYGRPDFSLLLYRLGQRLRLELRTNRLPQPFMDTDPNTGASLGRFYLQSAQTCQQNLSSVCQHFEDQFAPDVSCSLHTVTDWPPHSSEKTCLPHQI